MNSVVERIRAEIGAQSVIPWARFMELALYCPDCGYYEKENDNIGRRGDFYTSVSVGPLFGELLAFQFADWLTEIPSDRWQLVEAGAHAGRLADDVLRWLRQWRPALFERVEYVIAEASERRRQWQREMLKEFRGRVRWVESDLAKYPQHFNGVIFSNELLDAMPVHRVGWSKQRRAWFEWGVSAARDAFAWSRMEFSPALAPGSEVRQLLDKLPAELLDALPEDFTTELGPAAERWWRNAAASLQHGRLMTLDYGLSAEECFAPQRAAGTLRAYHRHRLCEDLLANAGEQDLTAHVNFSALQDSGESAGMKPELLTTQAEFFVGVMKQYWPEAEQRGGWTTAQSRAFHTLVHPEHLGRAFRVLVQAR